MWQTLMNTGSDVNVLPRDLMTTLALNAKPSPIGTLRGFNGSDSPVLGTAVCQVQFGNEQPRQAEFLVIQDANVPILGFPTMAEWGLVIDCGFATLRHDDGTLTMCQSVEAVPKNC